MTEIVTRIYDFQERAGEAVEALKEAGFLTEQINQVTAPGGHNTGSETDQASRQETIAAAIRKGGVRREVIGIYTDAVSRGGSLVSVRALFGMTGLAIEIMDSFGPVPVDLPVLKVEAKQWDKAAPLSSLFGIPLTIKEIPKTLPADFSLSKFLGLPVLSEKAAPLSAWFGIPVLMDKAAPLSAQFNIPLVSEKSAPLSDLVKLPVSLGSGASLSALLGIPLTLKKRSAE